MPFSPLLPALLISLLAVACTALLIACFHFGLRRSTVPPPQRDRATSLLNLAAVLWFVLVGLLAYGGFFSNFAAKPPRLLFAIFVPALALWLASFSSLTLPEAIQHTPISWLFYLQTFRVIVELVLWRAYKGGFLPVQMTFDGRNFDILAGLTAPLAGWIWQRTGNRIFAIAWNLAGLALLLNIIVVAILSAPTPFRVFTDGPANTLLAQFPFIYLPAVLVPVAYTAHLVSLLQLRSQPSVSELHQASQPN